MSERYTELKDNRYPLKGYKSEIEEASENPTSHKRSLLSPLSSSSADVFTRLTNTRQPIDELKKMCV